MKQITHYHVLLVEDEYFIRQGLAHMIGELDDIYVISGQAANGAEALEILQKTSIQYSQKVCTLSQLMKSRIFATAPLMPSAMIRPTSS